MVLSTSPLTNAQGENMAHDLSTLDIVTPHPTATNSFCKDSHPHLQYLNEIQSKFRGKVGGQETENYLRRGGSPLKPPQHFVSWGLLTARSPKESL